MPPVAGSNINAHHRTPDQHHLTTLRVNAEAGVAPPIKQ
jgi:hypothetical protein